MEAPFAREREPFPFDIPQGLPELVFKKPEAYPPYLVHPMRNWWQHQCLRRQLVVRTR